MQKQKNNCKKQVTLKKLYIDYLLSLSNISSLDRLKYLDNYLLTTLTN